MKDKLTAKKFYFFLLAISIFAMALRLTGLSFEGVDYEASLLPWFLDFKNYKGFTGLAYFHGDYNIPYVTILCMLSWLPVPPIVSIKMSSVLFDYITAAVLMLMVKEASAEEKARRNMLLAHAIFLCNPVSVINSGYLAQCESMWMGLALLSFWMLWKERPAAGMLFFGFAFAIKPQGVFIFPILLIYYFYKRNFSAWNFIWIPAGIELLCVPAIIGGCPADVFLKFFRMMMGHYPYVYYYYPNFWTYLKEAPYYIFGKVAIFSAFAALLLFAVLFLKSGRRHKMADYMEYIAFTSMTCAMILPCMHERYNYLAETLLAVCVILCPEFRLPAILLIWSSSQCNGASYLGWPFVSHDILAAVNIVVYFYLAWHCLGSLYKETRAREEVGESEKREGKADDARESREHEDVADDVWESGKREDVADVQEVGKREGAVGAGILRKLQAMPRWENALLDWVEKNMLLFAALFLALLALYLRKIAVWWNYENIVRHFDMHENHTESAFYYLLLRGAQYLPLLPLHSFKWFAGLADFALVVLGAKIGGGKSRSKQFILYTVLLFSPVLFLRGVIWAQPDSVALVLLLAAWLLRSRARKKDKRWLSGVAVLAAGAGLALAPSLLVVFLLYQTGSVCAGRTAGKRKPAKMAADTTFDTAVDTAAVIAVMILIQLVSAAVLRIGWREGLSGILRFVVYHPLTGSPYTSPGEWLRQMMIGLGVPVGVLSILYCADRKNKRSLLLSVLVNIGVTLLYARVLFP